MGKYESLRDVHAKLEEARNNMKKTGRDALAEAFKEFFNLNPDITALKWSQYTPYFNDGDPCTFRRHEMEIQSPLARDKYSEKNGQEPDTEAFYDDYCLTEESQRELTSSLKSLGELEDILDDELMETVFGDGVTVIATIDGFEIDQCDHE